MICNGFNGVNAFTPSCTRIPYYKKEIYDIIKKVQSSDGMLAISALDVLVVQYQSAFKVQCACAFVQSFIQSLASAIESDVNE